MRNILERIDLLPAQQYFTAACGFSRAHSKLAEWALKRFGDHGPGISGCVRDHFPGPLKDHLRHLAKEAARASEMAHYNCRPRRVRRSTLHVLARAVAKRDGSGFYGPQA